MNVASVFELSTWDVILLALLAVLAFRWWKRRNQEIELPAPKTVPPLLMSDFTISELKKYNGVTDEHILFALNGTVYDVTRGHSFYGPGSAYGNLAGHDATRALAKMDVKAVSDEWDDHAGLDPSEKETADEWESSFKFKYPKVGRLVKNEAEKHDYKDVPLRWDENIWISQVSVNNEASLLKAFAEKVSASRQRECYTNFEDTMCGLRRNESGEDREEAEE